MRRLLLLIVLGAAVCPGAAGASTITSAGGELRLTGAPGEENSVAIAIEGDAFVVRDSSTAASPVAGPGCTKDPGLYTPARCPTGGVQRIVVDLADGDDILRLRLPPASAPVAVSGGAGRDNVFYGAPEPVRVTLDGLANDGPAPRADNVQGDIEGVSGSGAAGDVLVAGAAGTRLAGLGGADTLTGGGGNDRIDSIDDVPCADPDETGCTRPARDVVRCGAGRDIADADRRDSIARDCEVRAVNGRVLLTRRSDRFTAFREGLTIVGGRGNDRLSAGRYSVTILGGRGRDRLRGGRASSELRPGSGRDVVVSGPEFDAIYVRDGEVDRVRCGGGRDFVHADRRDKVARDCRQVVRR